MDYGCENRWLLEKCSYKVKMQPFAIAPLKIV